MFMTNKRYPDEFKIEAVRQITDRGHSVADVSKRLDVSTHSLYAWIKKFGPDSEVNQSRNKSLYFPIRGQQHDWQEKWQFLLHASRIARLNLLAI